MYRINTMIRQKWTGLCFWAALLVTPSLFASSAVISWQSNTESDLAGYKIYYGTSSGKYSVILNVGKVVKYEINDLTSNMVYYFAVTAYDQSGNESGFSSEVSYLAEDKDPPTVVSAACELIDKVRVVFSEAVEKVSAEMPSNYKIDKGIVVQKAELQSDNKTVTLNTTQHPNGSYTLTVQNVRDRATVPNAMTSGQASYTWNVVDTTPPTVLSVKLLLKDLLAVEFSEPLNQASALDSLNYSILPSMKIKSRGIDDSFRKVFLSTDFHEVGKTYTLTVKNVKDGAGNTIASNTQKTYVCTSDDSIPPILIAVRLKSKTAVELQFNEKLDGATAEIKTNYTITPSVTVQSAVLSSDKTVVALTTAEHQAGSYSVTVKSVGDNAYPSNLLDSSTLEYTYTPSDVTPPGLQAVEMTSNNILKVVFNESVDEASATFKGNYVIDPHVNISSASLDGSRKIVFLVTEPHPAGSYRVTVNGVKDCSGNPIQSGTYKSYVYQAPDEVPPELLRAELHGSDVLELIFSETLDRITSERIANYRIEPAVEIKTAALVGDSLNKVYLQTAHHPQGKTYTVTVQGVVDRAVVPNAIKTGTKTTYEFPLVDTTPPRLVSVELLGDYFLELNFSEPMDRASAETLASYSVTPSLGVTKATLDASLKKVLLKTGKHQPGTDYRVIVQNVKDLAIPPNTIGDENKKDYSCVSLDAVPPRLVRAELLGNTVLELTFSEGLEETSALDKKNYGIDHGVSILEVKLSRTQECVYLTTTSHKQGTYTVTVQSVKDMASIPNLIQSENNYTYTYTPPDTIPPVLLSVDVLNASMVKLTFNEPLHRLSVEDTTHYAINNGVTVKRAFLDADMTRVILQTSEHKPGSYTITLNGIQDGSSSRNAIVRNTVGHYTYVINDQTPPKIVSAVLDNDKKLVVDFSETLDLASAESRSNYVINNNIEVKNAYLISSGNRVVLETSAHAAGEYILTVNGIKDASTSKNPIAPYSQIFYSWSPIDTVGPELVSATLHTNSNLKLTFNEPVDGVESKKIGNYQINPYVQILHAVLDADLNVVWLTTAPHNPGSYSVTVSNVKDRAFKSNSMGLQNKVDYRYIPPDVDPPSLVSVTIKSPMLLQLVFSEELSRTSAENVVNYSISPNMKIYQASLLATLTTVLLETDSHQAMTNYTISIQGIKDRAPIPNVLTNPITKNYIYTPPDSDPPELLSVKLQGTMLLELIFNEPLERTSAEKRNNYRIDMGVEVQSAALDTVTLKKVFLGTTQHMPGITYNLNIQNVKDRSPIPNTIKQNTWFAYSMATSGGTSVDNIPPAVARLEVISSTAVDVIFTEPVDKTSAETHSNYAIDDSISVQSALLDSNLVRVHLKTSAHRLGKPYKIRVSKIKDRASQPNVLSSEMSMKYLLVKGAALSNLNRNDYGWVEFHVGNRSYMDRDYTITQIPVGLEGAVQILTANDDKACTGEGFITFEMRGEATVYVARDKRIASIPGWLSDWKVTGDQIVNSHSGVFQVYSKEMTSGLVNLGGNGGSIDDNMYLVFMVPHSASGTLLADLSKTSYQLAHLTVGDAYYIDRDYTITSIPDSLEGLLWIRTANDDKVDRNDDFLRFMLNEASFLYVAYDSKIASLPKWLAGWKRLNEKIVDSRGTQFDVFIQEYPSGEVILGGNCGTMDDNMYFVLIHPIEGGRTPEVNSEMPGFFTLTQNYPNPFNPMTRIPYAVHKEGQISLSIINVIGQTVKVLVDKRQPIGHYEEVWDGTNEREQRVASGVYFCRLVQGQFAKTRRMMLIR